MIAYFNNILITDDLSVGCFSYYPKRVHDHRLLVCYEEFHIYMTLLEYFLIYNYKFGRG